VPRHAAALGRAIRRVRLDKGLSQEALAEWAGLDRTYISGLERGVRNPAMGTIEKVATALGVRISALFIDAEREEVEKQA
jgi:transcriptional regulator with XRE-family HTH domain